MGDHRAGPAGTTAVPLLLPVPGDAPGGARPAGRRIARHAAEQSPATPYAGRRVAAPVTPPAPATPAAGALPYVGRRAAARPAVTPSAPQATPRGRRIALGSGPADVSGHLASPRPAETLEAPAAYVGRRVARPAVTPANAPQVVEPLVLEPLVLEPLVLPAPVAEPPALEPLVLESLVLEPLVLEPLVLEPLVLEPLVLEPLVLEPLSAEPAVAEPLPDDEPVADSTADVPADVLPAEALGEPPAPAPKPRRAPGRRAAARRGRVPSLPLLAGVAVLAISAGGALQAMGHQVPAAGGSLSPSDTLSNTSAVLSGRGALVSRSADRAALSSRGLLAAANAQARQRDAALSAYAAQAQKTAAHLARTEWVLPIPSGDYQLTARFGDYSPLWQTFHTGLDFAAPTGTPIHAVAGGVITSVGFAGAYGNRTVELLPDGTELWYCHQNTFGTAVGAKVVPGQVIGYVGATGNVTGPHLHLEVHPHGGPAVDPYTALVDHGLYPGPPA